MALPLMRAEDGHWTIQRPDGICKIDVVRYSHSQRRDRLIVPQFANGCQQRSIVRINHQIPKCCNGFICKKLNKGVLKNRITFKSDYLAASAFSVSIFSKVLGWRTFGFSWGACVTYELIFASYKWSKIVTSMTFLLASEQQQFL